MASIWYPAGIDALMEGSVALLTDTIKVVLVDTGAYTYVNTHDFLDDVPAGARIATGTLASKTSTFSSNVWTFDAADTTLSAVTGAESEIVIIYKDTGVESTSRLLLKLDLASPVTPNGGDIVLQYNASGLGTITCTGA
jgi:hypothetical protein